jgi:hypothetical protein
MPAYTAFPPEDRILAAIDRVIRTGIPGIAASQPPTAWAAGAPCPSGHSVLPAGVRVYLADADEDMATPAIVVFLESDPQRAIQRWEGLWSVECAIDLLMPLDAWETQQAHTIAGFLKNLLTNDIALPSGGVSRASDRLSDAGLLVIGGIEENNFTESSVERLQDNASHPLLSIRFRIICAGLIP